MLESWGNTEKAKTWIADTAEDIAIKSEKLRKAKQYIQNKESQHKKPTKSELKALETNQKALDKLLADKESKINAVKDRAAKQRQEVNEKVNEKVNERQKLIISAIFDNPYITQTELARTLGISVVHVNKNMKKLQEQGLIRRVGPDKGGYWEVLEPIVFSYRPQS